MSSVPLRADLFVIYILHGMSKFVPSCEEAPDYDTFLHVTSGPACSACLTGSNTGVHRACNTAHCPSTPNHSACFSSTSIKAPYAARKKCIDPFPQFKQEWNGMNGTNMVPVLRLQLHRCKANCIHARSQPASRAHAVLQDLPNTSDKSPTPMIPLVLCLGALAGPNSTGLSVETSLPRTCCW